MFVLGVRECAWWCVCNVWDVVVFEGCSTPNGLAPAGAICSSKHTVEAAVGSVHFCAEFSAVGAKGCICRLLEAS